LRQTRADAVFPRYLVLTDVNGPLYIARESIMYISGPFVAKDNPESRTVGLTGNLRVYVLNTAENCAALGIPYDRLRETAPTAAPAAPKRPRGRPRKTPPPAVAAPTTNGVTHAES
jgi:hypothetical protein